MNKGTNISRAARHFVTGSLLLISEIQQRRNDLGLCDFWINDFRKCVVFRLSKMSLNKEHFDTFLGI